MNYNISPITYWDTVHNRVPKGPITVADLRPGVVFMSDNEQSLAYIPYIDRADISVMFYNLGEEKWYPSEGATNRASIAAYLNQHGYRLYKEEIEVNDYMWQDRKITLNKKRPMRESRKKTVKLTEEKLRSLVKEVIREMSEKEVQVLNGNFATIKYLALKNQYRVEYGKECYYFPEKGTYQKGSGWKSIKNLFDSENDAQEFCKSNKLKVIDTYSVVHRLSNGLPDTRAISDDMAQFM